MILEAHASGPFGLPDLRWFSHHEGGDGRGSILIYDGDCGFCTTAARWAAQRFRQGERAEAWQLLGEGHLEQYGLSLEDVQAAAWWVDGRGLREPVHRAVGRALWAGGGLRTIVSWFVLTPPTGWLAAGVYRLVVRWRYRLPGGTPACRIDTRLPKA
jgi:predicted DCC family thiol-disulfide oxidoreductase YuxK